MYRRQRRRKQEKKANGRIFLNGNGHSLWRKREKERKKR